MWYINPHKSVPRGIHYGQSLDNTMQNASDHTCYVQGLVWEDRYRLLLQVCTGTGMGRQV